MGDSKKILIVYKDPTCVCTIKCCYELSQALNKYIKTDIVYYEHLQDSDIEQHDTIIFQKSGTGNWDESYNDRIFAAISRFYCTKIFVYLIDDYLIEDNRGLPKRFMAACHAVICGNNFMADLLRKYKEEVYTFKTFADMDLIRSVVPNQYDNITLVWMSTSGLGVDLMLEIVPRLQRYNVICLNGPYLTGDRLKLLAKHSNVHAYGVLKFDEAIKILKGAHILLNPVIADNNIKTYIEHRTHISISDFLNCKAEIKYVLAGATKTCLLSTGTYAYANVVRNYENGVLLSDSPDEWVAAIDRVANTDLRENIISKAYEDVIDNYNLDVLACRIIEILSRLHAANKVA